MRRKTKAALALTASALLGIAAVLTGFRYWPRAPIATQIPTSSAVFDRNGELLRLTLARDQQYRLWTPLDAVSAEFIEALLLHEDQHFYAHPGVNPAALVRAAWAKVSGGARQGGSTLSMQLARLFYQLDTRSIPGKLKQIFRALQLELSYSKHDLLEAHLNLLPYGGNVQGIGTASLVYFGKRPDQISLPEALTLVLIPQAPTRRHPRPLESPELTQARSRLFARWQAGHPTTDAAGSMSVPLQYTSTRALPFLAPHFVDHVLTANLATARIDSTLDVHQQRLVERVIRQYICDRRTTGIHNASALLIDARDLSVRAMVGSADFFDSRISGQVNGTTAKRSPGSALKPFIYGLAIDQGLIHPMTVLKDAPSSFGAFSPENFDGRFVGPINATQALIRSRNVPAVWLTSQLSNPSLHQFLQSAGIEKLKSARHYGLALALGGSEVTAEELGMLYAMLANRGHLASLRYLGKEAKQDGPSLLSAEASFMVLDMLQKGPRPDDTPTSVRAPINVAWKTGTSWGFRDAWTAGVFGPYVLVVWVGNFDGSSNAGFIGIQAAAPLFFRLFDALVSREPALRELHYDTPARLLKVAVCTASGDLPNAACPQTTSTWYLPGVSPIKLSTIHRQITIDSRTGKVACPPFGASQTRTEVFEYWPSDLAQLFAQAGMPRRQAPENHCLEQDAAASDNVPGITSPLTGTTYTLRRNTQSVPLAANLSADSRRVYWFVNSSYVGAGDAGIAIGWMPAQSGRYTVLAVDDQGRSSSRELNVEWLQ
jgi:penicillin-binding protein 1C